MQASARMAALQVGATGREGIRHDPLPMEKSPLL